MHDAGRVLWMIPPEEATEDNLSSTDVSLAATPIPSPRTSIEEVRRSSRMALQHPLTAKCSRTPCIQNALCIWDSDVS